MTSRPSDKPGTSRPHISASAREMERRERLRTMRILIVHHDLKQLAHILLLLEQQGFSNLVLASRHEEALQYVHPASGAEAGAFDAILLDAALPDNDSYRTCRELRRRAGAVVPVIMLGGDDTRAIEQQCYEAGATDIWPVMDKGPGLAHCLTLTLLLKLERDLCKQRDQQLKHERTERKAVEARLQYLVAHDELTGLYNRRRLEQMLELALINAQHNQRASALLYLDMDQFRLVNDVAGHTAGDRLLVEVTQILRRHIKPTDILARIGADEFLLLVEGLNTEQALEQAEALRHAVDGFMFETSVKTYHVSLSIGIALIEPHETITVDEALARADQACYVAKTLGRNRIHFFSRDDSVMHLLQSDAYWAPKIRHALAHDMLCLVFQPVISANDGVVRHYEALVRLVGDDGELITPNFFIPVAERTGLIHEIDLWVVKHAIHMLASLAVHQSDLVININLSTQVLQHAALLPLVRDTLQATGVEARRITFEITETAAIASLTQTRKMIDQLRALGCCFALDDFGAGFNSYNYLKHFPVDYLKIDGTFITNLISDPVDQALVRSMIAIAHTLGKKTVAEFVENAETLALLKDYRIDYAQGYHLGRPERHLLQ
ncbi:MAG: EAL domain-containing protein [Gammaproteobacteria bacterium]|nr:EAL domain-containing protein [Gammaproteobacteria bacterium]